MRADFAESDIPAGSGALQWVVLGLLSLWDFYFMGAALRPFDLLALAGILLAATFRAPSAFLLPAREIGAVALLWSCVLVYGLAGVLQNDESAKPLLGSLLGAFAFTMYRASPGRDPQVLLSVTRALLIAHCAAFWLQFATYHLTGVLINYHQIFGAEPRVFGKGFRACGLYLEPAHFALSMFLLSSLRCAILRRIDGLVLLVAVSVFASLSLWGIIAFSGLLFFMLRRNAVFWSLLVLLLVGAVAIPGLMAGSESFWLAKRVMNLGTDAGVLVRYGVLLDSVFVALGDTRTWFGGGTSNDYLAFGASGFGFLTQAVGLIGAAMIVGLAIRTFHRQKQGVLAYAFVLSLTGTSMWTYLFWWVWLAIAWIPVARGLKSDAGAIGAVSENV